MGAKIQKNKPETALQLLFTYKFFRIALISEFDIVNKFIRSRWIFLHLNYGNSFLFNKFAENLLNKTDMKKIIFALLLFFSLESFSQSFFNSCYIVLNNNDTVYGEIEYKNDFILSNLCVFKKSQKDIQITYHPFDIQEYMVNNRLFISKKINNEVVFIEEIIKGKISIYSLMDQDRNIHYFINKNDSNFMEIPYKEKIIDKNGERYLYKSKLHIGLLKEYMKDVPSLFTSIEKIQQPNRDNLTQLVENYHKKISQESNLIKRENKIVYIKISPEIKAGYIFRYKKPSVEFQRPNCDMSLSAYFSFPRIDDNIYLKAGVDLLNKGLNHVTIAFPPINITFPIGIEYRFDKGQKIIPKIYAGGHILAPLINISPGVIFRLNEHYLISTNLDYIFVYPYPFYKEEKYVYSNFNCGVIYEF